VGEIETRLAEIWAEVLGLERVGRHDNFFELGGHSLLAVRLVAQVEQMFGKPLPLALLFQAPTVEQLAYMLPQKGRSAPPPSLLVPLQPNGSRSPFFCVHGYALLNARRYVPQDQPLYALVAHGYDGRHAPVTIEETVSDYLREIRTLQPNGPYFLGGFSAGGLIAFEMARQLNIQGQTVALLILFDPPQPQPEEFRGPSESSPYTPVAKLIAIPSFFSRHLSASRHLTIQRKSNYLLERIGGSVHKAEIWFYLRIGRRLPSHLRQLYAFNMARKIVREYRPQTYAGRVILLKTGEMSDDWQTAWERLAPSGLEIHKISGKHTEIFDEQHLQSWVNHFITNLDRTSEALRF
jgi:thioesterase domain-containing protein/acyl carrier protein